MTAQSQQDSQYITNIRQAASQVLNAADAGLGADKEWASCFTGETRLAEASFAGENAGLTKDDVLHALATLAELNVWLDTGSRRAYFQALRIIG